MEKQPINKPLGIAIGSAITVLFALSTFTMMTYDANANIERSAATYVAKASVDTDKPNMAVKRSGWEKLNYGDSLYGLPQISGAHKRTWDKMNHGEDLYGLPNIAVTDVKRQFKRNYSVSFVKKDVVKVGKITWDKINFGDEMYGLPQISGAHKRTWDRINYGDDLYGLPFSGQFHG